jgi:hypothetical protein
MIDKYKFNNEQCWIFFCVGILRDKIRIRNRNPVVGLVGTIRIRRPDPYQNVADPDHCPLVIACNMRPVNLLECASKNSFANCVQLEEKKIITE